MIRCLLITISKPSNISMRKMEINMKEITMVKPAEKTPRRSVPLSDLDLLNNDTYSSTVYFYRNDAAASNFFDATVLKEALSKVLVAFYPLAGRFSRDINGRLEIDCNDEGVVFVVAESSSMIDHFGDFAPSPELQKLVPDVDYSDDVSLYPFLLSQVTYFNCGGASLGTSIKSHLADGPSGFHFVNAWSEITRGIDVTTPPFLDRTIIASRDPPHVLFEHVEYQIPANSELCKQNKNSQLGQVENLSKNSLLLKLTREQINILKAKAKEHNGAINYSTFEVLAGHIWRCSCMARSLPNDQETRLYFLANGRSSGRYPRLQPPIPPGYFGNVVFTATSIAMAGDLQSKPLCYAASRIRETLVRLDNDYLRSAIDYVKLHPNTKRSGVHCCKSPNLEINSWLAMPTHEADFGWGPPFYMGPRRIMYSEGKVTIMPTASKDGSLHIVIPSQQEQMEVFKKSFYECIQNGDPKLGP